MCVVSEQPEGAQALATQSGGWKLHLSSRSASGYKGVRRCGKRSWEARGPPSSKGDIETQLGHFESAVDAAEGMPLGSNPRR